MNNSLLPEGFDRFIITHSYTFPPEDLIAINGLASLLNSRADAHDRQSLQTLLQYGGTDLIVVCTPDKQIVGMIMLVRELTFCHRYGHVRDLVVAPAYRHRGLGSALMAELLFLARAHRLSRVFCDAPRDAIMKRILARHAFEDAEEISLRTRMIEPLPSSRA